jgi:uncharacterized membrane protein YdfJ with MMPL/SSD domain
MRSITTQQHYEASGASLKVVLTTDHGLTPAEREDLDHIADACHAFAEHHRPHHHAGGGDDIDEAIWELGGEEGITAG